MYAACIFCSASLGENDVVEEFPIGRRLAFDPVKGRLWALCPRCRQWNLSPLEERWEALESLDRLYQDTPTRYSTGEIGITRHPEGLEVVRIGEPKLPEYAAWRYGGELLRRRRRALLIGGAGVVGVGGVLGGVTAGVIAGTALVGFHVVNLSASLYRGVLRTAARVELPDGEQALLKERHVQEACLRQEGDAWQLRFPHVVGTPMSRLQRLRWSAGSARVKDDPVAILEGDAAVVAAGKILPALNRSGASARLVHDATRFVEETGSVDEAFRRALRTVPSAWRSATARPSSPARSLYRLPGPVRLGLEMAAHETAERRALEGELAELERDWRAAEEIAAIADDLLLPDRVRKLLPSRRPRP